jgi:hypothetical protein
VDDQLARIKDQIDRINEDLGSQNYGSQVDDLRIKVENKIGNLDEELVKVKKMKVEKILVELDILIKGNVQARYYVMGENIINGIWSNEVVLGNFQGQVGLALYGKSHVLVANISKSLEDFGEMM